MIGFFGCFLLIFVFFWVLGFCVPFQSRKELLSRLDQCGIRSDQLFHWAMVDWDQVLKKCRLGDQSASVYFFKNILESFYDHGSMIIIYYNDDFDKNHQKLDVWKASS